MENNNQKTRKVPMRQCLGCNEHKPKREMIRVVRTPEGAVELDFVGKKSGRGAYICPKRSCFAKARKSKRIENILEVKLPEEIYDRMEQSISEAEEQDG
ncbi:MAG: YlxR family protein [Clostridia bacterium]|nr:YlxR family protein [Clostridia bacterium]MBR2971983.1 YlxR family protein [Clostridia bacterium]MBR4032216.1 YlxR family protein [Clostridia bacterium]